MASPPSLAQIAGNNVPTYEAYFQKVDVSGKGIIGAMDAAAFLKKSGLNEKTLGLIWSFADSSGQGFLDKQGFYVALKLIALTQNNVDASMANIMVQVPAPNMGDAGSPAVVPPGDTGWKIKMPEKAKYDKIFNNLNPVNGKVPGSVVKPVLLNSKLPLDILGKIWDLSDIDKDGFLDDDEFSVAMHLVYRALEKEPVPTALPPDLIPPSKRQKKLSLAGAVPVLPVISNNTSGLGSLPGSPLRKNTPPVSIPGPPTSMSKLSTTGNWVVTPAELNTYDAMFIKADTDSDGFVTGVEIKDSLIQTGAPHQVLAHIWGLVDSKGVGRVNNEQFALIMHLIHQKIQGIDPPPQLTPEMIPPTLRRTSVDGFPEDGPSIEMPSSNKEIDAITKEIELLKSEKMILEKDRAQRDADIKIRNGEVQSLQKELDAITATLNQLETQKGEAQKRLDELDEKRSNLENSFKDLKEKCGEEQRLVDSLRSQITCQEISIKGQEEELSKLRVDLNDLRSEEAKLEQQVEAGQTQLETVLKSLKETHQEHQQQKLRLQQLREQADKMSSDCAELPDLVLHNGSIDLNDFQTTAFHDNNEMVGSIPLTNGTSSGIGIGTTAGIDTTAGIGVTMVMDDAFKEDPFGNDQDPFKNEDPFANHVEDPFTGHDPFSSDPFTEDPFKDDLSNQQKEEDPFKDDDPFNSAFENAAKGNPVKNDPFDPFGDKSSAGGFTSNTLNADPFGSDPFSPHTPPARPKSPKPPRPSASPTPRGKSPVPALPPKTRKAPPRPAPPRPAPPRKTPSPVPPAMRDPFNNADPFSGNSKPNSLDPFANNSSDDAFANFADFSPGKMDTEKISESEQLAWARRESIKQHELQHRAKEQEQADLELAIRLSKADMSSA